MGSNRRVRSTHRMLSFVLSLIMVISLIPVSVLADDEIKNPTETIEQSFIAGLVSLPKAEVIPEQDVADEEDPAPVIVSEQVPETEAEEEIQPEIIPEEIPGQIEEPGQVKEPEQIPEAVTETEPEEEPKAEVEKEPEQPAEPELEEELVPETEQEIIPEEETEQTPSPKKTIKIYTQAEIEEELKKETAPEKVVEAEPEKEPEQVVEPEKETEPEAEAELEKETEAEVEAEVEPEKDPEVIEEPEQETDVETEPEVEVEKDPEQAVEPEQKTEQETDPEAEVEPEKETEAEAEPEAEQEKETEEEVEKETETAAEPEKETEAEPEPEKEPEQVAEPEEKKEEKTEEQQDSTPKTVVPRSTRSNPSANSGTKSSTDYRFAKQPPMIGNYDPETLHYRVTWQTSFIPLRVVIMQKNEDGDSSVFATLTSGLSADGYYDIPARSEWASFTILAYYGRGSADYVESNYFVVSKSELKILEQPKSAYVNPEHLYFNATWKTSFTPLKVEIYKSAFPNELIATLNSSPAEGSYKIPLEHMMKDYVIRMYYGYGENDYVTSDRFTVYCDRCQFTTQPASGSYFAASKSYTVHWETSFVPYKVEIMVENFQGYEVYATLYSLSTTEGYYTLRARSDIPKFCIRAYFGLTDEAYTESKPFTVNKVNLKFTTQPANGWYDPATLQYYATWQTSFTPVKYEILYENEGTFVPYHLETNNLSTNGYHTFAAHAGVRKFYIRAYYGYGEKDYTASDAFTVSSTLLCFNVQPSDGFFDFNSHLYRAAWQTSFKPLKVEIRYGDAVIPQLYSTITSNLSANGYYYFPYLDWYNYSKHFRLYAYYGTGPDDYVESRNFYILTEQPASSGSFGYTYSWRYENHTLTISGQGMMPLLDESEKKWRYFRSQITTIVINDGPYNVSGDMFSGCLSLETLYLPASVDYFLYGSFSNCPNLKDVYCDRSEAQGVESSGSSNTGLYTATWHYSCREEGECGADLKWKVTNDNTLIISGKGDMYNWESETSVPWYKYSNDIAALQIDVDDDATIGKYAFACLKHITSVTIPQHVTCLGEYAFCRCSSLTSVTINNANLDIPAYCFYYCTALQSIAIPKNATTIGMYAFCGCASLTQVTFRSGSALTTIDNNAFDSCRNLENVTIPDGVTTIGSSAFKYCRSLTSLKLPASLQSIGVYTFAYCMNITGTITIPSGVERIPEYCFTGCEKFNTLSFGTNVKCIAKSAFGSCTKLSYVHFNGFRAQLDDVTIETGNSNLNAASHTYLYIYGRLDGDTVYSIYGYDGQLCVNGTGDLTGNLPMPWDAYGKYINVINISGSFTGIGQGTFKSCSNAKELYLPGTVNYIGLDAFKNCSQLTDIYFDGVLSQWYAIHRMQGNIVLDHATLHCTGEIFGRIDGTDIYWSFDDVDTLALYFDMDCGDTEMPDFQNNLEQPWIEYASRIRRLRISEGVTYLGNENFSCLENLEIIDFPSSIKRMGSGVFANCDNLEDVILPDSVESITGSTFWECSNLLSVQLPSTITKVPAGMFYNCGSLYTVSIPGTVTRIDDKAFNDCDGLTDVYFGGTSGQWYSISIGSGNEILNNVTVHFVEPELEINSTNFPDDQFRRYVSMYIDTDNSGWLTDAERLAVKEIDCTDMSIGSLDGILFFPELKVLDCSKNNLSGELDLRESVKLQEVWCGKNSALTSVLVDDLSELMVLYCNDNTNMKSLNVYTNNALRKLNVSYCQLSGLNVSNNKLLEELICNDNKLAYLDLSKNLNLKYLDCHSNKLTRLDLTKNSLLSSVDCADNEITYIKLDSLPNCSFFRCHVNNIESLDIVGCPLLMDCVLDENCSVTDHGYYITYNLGKTWLYTDTGVILLTEHEGIKIDEEHFPDSVFREFIASTDVDTDQNGWLNPLEIERVTEMEVAGSGITDMTGLQYFTYLKELIVMGNDELTELDLSGNPELEYLDCAVTNIGELDLSANRRLVSIDCADIPLTSLDVSGLTSLKSIVVSGCNLTELDVSGCVLNSLWCYDNPLTNLVLGNQPELYGFRCYRTDLTELDISRCPLLVDEWLNGTREETNGILSVRSSYDHWMMLDSDQPIVYVRAGVPIDTSTFPDDIFRAYVEKNFDTDKNGWLSDEEIANIESISIDGIIINDLKGIEFFTALSSLCIGENELSYLDLGGNTELLSLECYGNRITVLDLRKNTKLQYLDCYSMGTLVGLNVSGLTNLSYIDVSDCSLTELDVSDCPLTFLGCEQNPLTRLTLGDQPNLYGLYCYDVDLNELDISGSPKLVDVWLNGEREYAEWGMNVHTATGYMELDPDTEIHYLDFVGANMTLGNELSMSFFVNKDDVEINQGYYIKITKIYEDREDVVVIVPSSEWTLYQNKYYRIRFNGVAAKEMNDRINVQMFDAADNAVSDVWEDSVADYVMRALPKAPDRERRLMVDMLNYGAAAQVYFNYNTENLANGYLTEEWQEYATKNVTTENKRIAGENYYGTVLNLGSRLQMSMYFNNLSTNMYAIVSFTDHYGHEKEVTIEGNMFKEEKANLFRIYIEEMAVADARQMITCKVYNTDGAVVAEAIDSIESYIARATAVSSNPLYEEVMKFADSAYAYFHP